MNKQNWGRKKKQPDEPCGLNKPNALYKITVSTFAHFIYIEIAEE